MRRKERKEYLPSNSPYGAERCGGTAHQNQRRPAEPEERKINKHYSDAKARSHPIPPKERDHDSNNSSAVVYAGAKPEIQKKKSPRQTRGNR